MNIETNYTLPSKHKKVFTEVLNKFDVTVSSVKTLTSTSLMISRKSWVWVGEHQQRFQQGQGGAHPHGEHFRSKQALSWKNLLKTHAQERCGGGGGVCEGQKGGRGSVVCQH